MIIKEILDKVIKENPVEVEKYKKGDRALLGFFMGKIHREISLIPNHITLIGIVRKALDKQ